MIVKATFNINDGTLKIITQKEVVEEVEDPASQLTVSEAFRINKKYKLGDIIETEQPQPKDFGRIAAIAAKQAIMQNLHDTENNMMIEEYSDRIGQIVSANIQRIESKYIKVDLGRASALFPRNEQVPGERYNIGEKLKFYIKKIEEEGRAPQMILSRACPEFVIELFKNEVPEIEAGGVIIEGAARMAGIRTKILVSSSINGVDPAGTLIGGRGVRVRAVNNEIGEYERLDIVPKIEDDMVEQIRKALAPAEVGEIIFNKEDQRASVKVSKDQYRVAIGKAGSNVRLAGQLLNIEIDVTESDDVESPEIETPQESEVTAQKPKASNAEDNLLAALNQVQED
jgi:N utilization substance protein A